MVSGVEVATTTSGALAKNPASKSDRNEPQKSDDPRQDAVRSAKRNMHPDDVNAFYCSPGSKALLRCEAFLPEK